MSGRDDRAFSDLQRALILRAMVELIAERGYANVSLAMVLERAGVSRHVFRTHFAGVEDCFTAILDAGMERMAAVMLDAFDGQEDWLDGLLAAEAAVLSSLDADPEMARVLLVDSLAAGSWALERRVRNVQALRAQIVERWRDAPPARQGPRQMQFARPSRVSRRSSTGWNTWPPSTASSSTTTPRPPMWTPRPRP